MEQYPTEVCDEALLKDDDYQSVHNSERDDRLTFVRKVLGIVTTQLVFSMSMCLLSSYCNWTWCQSWWIILLAFLGFIGSFLALFFTSRIVPQNYLLLSFLTLCQSLIFCGFTAELTTESVLVSVGVTAATLSFLFGGALMCPSPDKIVITLSIALLLGVFTQTLFLIFLLSSLILTSTYTVVWATLGAILSGSYVIIDLTFLLVPGAFSLDDYILGALQLYLDIMRLFFYILMLLSDKK